MAKIRWIVQSNFAKHVVVLEHGYVSGEATISVDAEILFHRRRKLIDWGLVQYVTAGDVECVVSVSQLCSEHFDMA